MNRQEILRTLLIDEDAMLERLVARSGKLFKIDRSGNIVFLIPASRLTQRQIIALVSLSRYFAAELGIHGEDTVTADDFLPYVDADKRSITARLADLKKEGVIQSVERGKFRVSILGISKVLDELEMAEGSR
jgi:hypothetical protein